MEVYLDNSATTRVAEVAVTAVNQALTENYGNPSSLHRWGLEAEHLLKNSRLQVASCLNVFEKEIIFTSGGTESNNLAIFGALAGIKDKSRPIVTSVIEHAAILNIYKQLEKSGRKVIYIKVDHHGVLDLEDLEKALREEPALISIMAVNNEIGVIQPLEDITQLIVSSSSKPIFHTDAVQAFGKIELFPKLHGIDLLSISSHKFHGPKGVGALFVRKGLKINPIMLGGSQEIGLRPGTENLPGIAGMSAAAQWSINNQAEQISKYRQLKEALINGLTATIPGTKINSPASPHFTPHILSISFRGVKGEILLHAMEQDQIYIATRSACTSKKKTYSHVLEALRLNPEEMEGTIRISFGHFNSLDEINYVLDRFTHHVAVIRRITGWRG